MEHWKRLADSLPFIPFMVGVTGNLNVQRLVEAAIIAVVTAGVTAYITTEVLEVKVSYLERSVQEIKDDVREIHRDLDRMREGSS